MSDAEQLELSWLFWPHGAYKQFAMEVNERQLFVLDLPNETARLLGEAFRQSAAAAEARGWARAVEALRDAQNRPDHTHDWAIMRHAADHLESLAGAPPRCSCERKDVSSPADPYATMPGRRDPNCPIHAVAASPTEETDG